MSPNNIFPILCESQALEASLTTMQIENNSFKEQLSESVAQSKDGAILQWAESINDSFTELERCIDHLKWELVVYNYKLGDYSSTIDSNVKQVLKNRNQLKKKVKVVKSMFNNYKQEFKDYLDLNTKHSIACSQQS